MSDVTMPAMRRRLILAAGFAVAVCPATSASRAQSTAPPDSAVPYLAVSQYQHDRWTTADGLPNNAIDYLGRTPDGYLWLGTEGGLVRFDGVRFTAFDRNNTDAFRGADFYPTVPLIVDRNSVLWIATTTGLVRYKDGEFTRAAPSRPNVGANFQMVEDRAGRLWLWERDIDGRSYEIRDGQPVVPDSRSGLPEHVSALAADPSGDLWVATIDRGVLRLRDGRATLAVAKTAMPGGVVTLHAARNGVLWIGTQRGFGRLAQGRFEFHPLGEGGLAGYVSAFAEDAAGDIWIGTVGLGVLRWHNGQLERFDRRDGLSRDQVTSLLIDQEGSIWIATRGGLDRLRRGTFATFTPRNGGPPFADPGALVWDRRGRFILAGATTGLVTGVPGKWAPLPGARAATSRKVWTITQGKHGTWVGGDDTLTLYRDGVVSRSYAEREGLAGKWMLAVAEDSLERVWVGTNQGLYRLTPTSVRVFSTADGLPHSYVRALIVDRRGDVWAGTNGGVVRVSGDSVRSWPPVGGVAASPVFAIRELQDGTIWLGTSGGLIRVRDETFASIRAEHGLPDDMVISIEQAGSDLWIATGSGISRIAVSELNAVADGRAARVHATTFGTRDGLPATEVVAGAQPLSTRTPDGRLWFSTAGGLAVVDPRHVPRNTIAPPVHIEELSADGASLTRVTGATSSVRVPPRARRVTLRYTATSLLLPDRVRFRYRLVGYDRGWVDASSAERTVSYTNLRPGTYTFRVTAANDAGVWNNEGASFEFMVAPAFYQTIWFAVLCAAALVGVFFAFHRARVLQLERRTEERKLADEALAKLRAELAHATRVSSLATLTASIAHEVSQPLSGIVTNASTCLRMLSNETPNVAGASEAARRLLRDGNRASDVITRLRALFSKKTPAAEPVDLNDATREVIALSRSDLQRARAALGVELADDLPTVVGDRVQLQQVIINLLRNACDAVHNVSGRPREIVIITARDGEDSTGERVRLSVRDSGVGLGPAGADKLFDAFYSTKPDGMGIGLSVCRSIVENHRGRIWATPNDGPGVTFTFSIPRTAAPPVEANTKVSSTLRQGLPHHDRSGHART